MSTAKGIWKRKAKRRVRKITLSLSREGYFENCNYHPCKVTDIEVYYPGTDGDINGISLIDYNATSCSTYNCAPRALTEKEAIERANFWKLNGQEEYMFKYIYEDSDEAREGYREMMKEWNFR